MNEKEFVLRKKADWDRLFFLTDRSEMRIKNLTGQELREFGRLYRRVAGDLAYVRTQGGNPALEQFLNDLIARGSSVLYRRKARPVLLAIADFLSESASAVRRRKGYVFTAIAIFLLSAAFGGSVVSKDDKLIAEFVPSDFAASLEQWKSKQFGDHTTDEGLAGTGMYVQNNTMATVYCASGGLTFGLASAYVLFFNGAMMGVFAHELDEVGGLPHFLTGISAHGVSEIGGIFIAGGAGFVMGWALVNPGRRTRGQSVRLAGKDAMYMIAVGVIMIWIAAPVEAFISFGNSVPAEAKLSFAAISFAAWMLLFVRVGRGLDAQRRAEFQMRAPTGN